MDYFLLRLMSIKGKSSHLQMFFKIGVRRASCNFSGQGRIFGMGHFDKHSRYDTQKEVLTGKNFGVFF